MVFLTTSRDSERAPQGAFSRPISTFYPQLKAYVVQHLGADAEHFFAEPVRDLAARKTDWFTEADGEPRPLSALTPGARSAALERLRDIRTRLEKLASEHTAEAASEVHHILQLSLNEPAEEDVFVVGGQPIVINWGTIAPGAFVPLDLSGFERARPSFGKREPREKLPGEDGDGRALKGLSPLSICTLVALALASGSLLARAAGLIPLQSNLRLPDLTEAAEGNDELNRLRELHQQNERTRSERDALQEKLVDRALACLSHCTPPLPMPSPVVPPSPPASLPNDTTPGEALKVPERAEEDNDLSFLEGIWQSLSKDLVVTFDEATDRPELSIVVEYELDALGQGTRRVLLEDGTVCTGTVSASFDPSGTLRILEGEPASCGTGYQVLPYEVICKIGADRIANCTLTPRGSVGATSIETELRRLQ